MKDSIDISGDNNPLCNRAWESFYPATKNTACAQVHIDTGAITVGQTNLYALLLLY